MVPSPSTDMYGLPDYLPAKPQSGDEQSTKRHIGWLQETFKSRSKADNAKVLKLMNLTLYKRREEIAKGDDIKKLLDQYPWLSNTDQVQEEFNHISDIYINENFATFLSEI